MSASDLQQIVKASHHLERLVFKYCDIHWSEFLDFKSYSKSNLSFLSFSEWGDRKETSDLGINPLLFENIAKAIAKSGLRSSVKQLDIDGCGLDIKLVQKMLKKYGMSCVNVDWFCARS